MEQDIKHSFIVEVKREQAWSFLWNLEAVAQCIPGCEEVRIQEAGKSYQARVRRNIGPFLIRMELDISVAESNPPQLIRVEVSGQDKRLRSKIGQKLAISLHEIGINQSRIDVATTMELSGMLTVLGERLLSVQIQQELDLFVACVQKGVEAKVPEETT
jgi:carbon monoxide dehydrogenase subunit G